MIPQSLSPLANHLWQSTLFAGAAWFLTLTLRNKRARVRYWVWVAASWKFLIPFSVLTILGSHVSWRTAPMPPQTNFSVALEQVSRPFTLPVLSSTPVATLPSGEKRVPTFLWAAWGCGSFVIACSWWIRWRRIRDAVRAGSPTQLDIPIRVISSPTLQEPGVFGVFRPVLLLPEGIFEHLSPEQWKTVLAHELCHVRHRDNLMAALQMFVETVFWFYPLAWWIGKRIVEERERGCDEEVRLANEPRVYAQAILKVCELYLESSVACVAGVSGSNLRKRIEAIMSNRMVLKLTSGQRLSIAAVGVLTVVLPFLVGMLSTPTLHAQQAGAKPKFEVASVKLSDASNGQFRVGSLPGGAFTASNATVMVLVQFAYDVRSQQISGGPGWLDSEKFNIEAKPDGANPVPSVPAQLRLMIQSLLEERFNLTLHHETKEQPIYNLVLSRGGIKMKDVVDTAKGSQQGLRMSPGHVTGMAAQMPIFAQWLSQQLGRSVLDKTGLTGKYDFDMNWAPSPDEFRPPGDPAAPIAASDPADSSIFTALQEQLGLRLESTKGPVDTLVIDHVERPSAN